MFDAIIGNPPYQQSAEEGQRALPLYHEFIDMATRLNIRYVSLIVPARWYGGGGGLLDFMQGMKDRGHLRYLVDIPNSQDVFSGVDIAGGVCYFLWDGTSVGPATTMVQRGRKNSLPVTRDLSEFDIIVRDGRVLPLLRKVRALREPSFSLAISPLTPFGLQSNFDEYHSEPDPGDLHYFGVTSKGRVSAWIAPEHVTKGYQWIDSWKVIIPKAGGDGGSKIPDNVFGKPFIGEPGSVCSQTFFFLPVADENEAKSALSYIYTRFARFMISLRKIDQHMRPSVLRWLPVQSWDRIYTDSFLYEKYGFTDEEIELLESLVRGFPDLDLSLD